MATTGARRGRLRRPRRRWRESGINAGGSVEHGAPLRRRIVLRPDIDVEVVHRTIVTKSVVKYCSRVIQCSWHGWGREQVTGTENGALLVGGCRW